MVMIKGWSDVIAAVELSTQEYLVTPTTKILIKKKLSSLWKCSFWFVHSRFPYLTICHFHIFTESFLIGVIFAKRNIFFPSKMDFAASVCSGNFSIATLNIHSCALCLSCIISNAQWHNPQNIWHVNFWNIWIIPRQEGHWNNVNDWLFWISKEQYLTNNDW